MLFFEDWGYHDSRSVDLRKTSPNHINALEWVASRNDETARYITKLLTKSPITFYWHHEDNSIQATKFIVYLLSTDKFRSCTTELNPLLLCVPDIWSVKGQNADAEGAYSFLYEMALHPMHEHFLRCSYSSN